MAVKSALAARLQRTWQTRGVLACLLWPISLAYASLLRLRRLRYQRGGLTIHRVPPVVLVIGNAVAGGAGKTPTTIAVVRHLQAKGYSVGVVSRGYGRQESSTQVVGETSSPTQVGDEPLLIHHATGAPTAVAPLRADAARALLQQHPQLQILVCDDGLQHYALYRDVEVCVFDDRGVGNGWLLPAGPLREPWPPQPLTAAGQSAQGPLVLQTADGPRFGGFSAQRSLAPQARDRQGHCKPLRDLGASGETVVALAGIARPEVFFAMLRQQGVPLATTYALADHADFSALHLDLPMGATLLCTEKDAHKLWQRYPQALAVPLELVIEPGFYEALDTRIRTAMEAKLSSRYGTTTA